jgi:hypothetical protein
MKLTLSLGLGGLIVLGLLGPLSVLACPPRLSPAVQTEAGQTDYMVKPDRVGSIRQTTTRDQLTAIFGAANLEDFTAHGPEGDGDFPATKLLHNGTSDLHILWQDDRRQAVRQVQIYGRRWRTAAGIAVGTPLTQLRQQFGEFKFYGFGWDYGGQLILEPSSKLAQALKANHLSFDLGTPTGRCEQFSQDCQAVMGEQEIATTNLHLKSLRPEIRNMVVTF